MARTSDRSGTVGIIVMVVGVIFAVAGVVTYFIVADQLAAENIKVSDDATYFAGQDVTGGKTYAELDREDPARTTAMQASFLRASLFTSVVAFGVAALAAVLGIMLILIGWSLRSLSRTVAPPGTASVDTASATA